MRRLLVVAALVGAAMVPVEAQQSGSLVVNVRNKQSGEPMQGAQVTLQGTSVGGVTNEQGRFAAPAVPAGNYTVIVQFIGYSEVRRHDVAITAGQPLTLDFELETAVLSLQELVVSGVSDPTAGIKLPFTVSKVTSEQLQVPTTNSALAAIQGKVAGVNIVRASGKPGVGVNILLRSPTGFETSNSPLFVVDGVVIARDLDGTTADIEALDIENIEVIKGAAAASLYGSRAAAGVISITTRRGRDQPQNRTRITSRTEFGKDYLAGDMPLTRSHHYLLNTSGTALANSAGRDTTWSGRTARSCTGDNTVAPCGRIADQPYPGPVFDNLHALYNPGQYLSQNFSLSQNLENTTFLVSVNRLDQAGALEGNDGFWRNTGRVSIDHRVGDRLSVSFTGNHSRTWEDVTSGDPYEAILTYPVFVDLKRKDAQGNYMMLPDSSVELENPIWRQFSRDHYEARTRTWSSLSARYSPLNWLSVDATISYDRADTKYQEYVPRGVPTDPESDLPATGSLELRHQENNAYNGAVGFTFSRQFGGLNARLATRGTFEREYMEEFVGVGTDFLVENIRDLSAARIVDNVSSETTDVRANGFYADLALDLNDRYVGSVLIRRDGSSLFGPLERWHTYKRASAAWIISRESWFSLPGVNELKLRYAMGEAGGRPSYIAQYESWNVSRTSGLTRENAGNPSLKPSFTREHDFGIDIIGLNNRLQLELVYARQMSRDQIITVPATVITGYSSVRANAAVLKGRTYEATITAYPIRTQDVTWSINAVLDNSETRLVEWNRSCFWGSNAGREHEFTCAGERAGDFWVQKTVRSREDLPSWLQDVADEFAVNDEGYLVWVGKDPATGETNSYEEGLSLHPTQCREGMTRCGWGASFSRNGFTYRWGEPFRAWNEDYDEVQRVNGGSSLPDVNFGFGSNFRYKGLSTYLGFRGQIGGSVYNEFKMWQYSEERHGDFDQSGKPDSRKKTIDYYRRGLAQNDAGFVDLFLEDATFLKLSEARVAYRFRADQMQRFFGRLTPQEMTLGLNGRNLFTLTGYSGFDPEAGTPLSRMETVEYPFLRTFTFTVDITF